MAIKKRGNTLSLYRRVPKRYASIEPRTFIWLSLHTDSMTVAQQKEPVTWQQMIDAWEAKLAGDTTDAEQRFEAARDLAAARGFKYIRAEKVAELPIEELLDRVHAVSGTANNSDLIEAPALLGAAQEPQLTVSKALELYWNLAADRVLGKSEDQARRWRNPRIKAAKNFIAVIGDKEISEITGDDMLDFRAWWLERIDIEDLTPNSANKDIGHLGDVLKTINEMKRLGLVLPLTGIKIKEGEAKQRPPFSDKWIKERLLAQRALDGLNSEARAILLIMINTGARPSEIASLTDEQIHLTTNVPHVSIEPGVRQLKSKSARRVIPLCGASLEAMRLFPNGFKRYRKSSAGLSATINKYLRSNGLLETPEHSLYGLRHSFEDRQLAADMDERIRRDLMGHSLNRVRYGKGASLEKLHDLVQATAL